MTILNQIKQRVNDRLKDNIVSGDPTVVELAKKQAEHIIDQFEQSLAQKLSDLEKIGTKSIERMSSAGLTAYLDEDKAVSQHKNVILDQLRLWLPDWNIGVVGQRSLTLNYNLDAAVDTEQSMFSKFSKLDVVEKTKRSIREEKERRANLFEENKRAFYNALAGDVESKLEAAYQKHQLTKPNAEFVFSHTVQIDGIKTKAFADKVSEQLGYKCGIEDAKELVEGIAKYFEKEVGLKAKLKSDTGVVTWDDLTEGNILKDDENTLSQLFEYVQRYNSTRHGKYNELDNSYVLELST